MTRRFAATLLALLLGCAHAPPGPARSDELFGRVRPGMSEQEVRTLLGVPDGTIVFSRDRHAWDYQYYDTWGYLALFSVTFGGDGRAVSKFSQRLNDGGDHH